MKTLINSHLFVVSITKSSTLASLLGKNAIVGKELIPFESSLCTWSDVYFPQLSAMYKYVAILQLSLCTDKPSFCALFSLFLLTVLINPLGICEMAAKQFTLTEVAKHNSKDDLYVIIDEKVYDASKFIDEHP